MTVHQCPKCELRFVHRTELDDHCWHDHPEFRHDYPAVAVAPEEQAEPAEQEPPVAHHERVHLGDSLIRWVVPPKRHE
jgi:hypothetical protein